MAKGAKKQHEKIKYKNVVIGPDKKEYTVGRTNDVELVRIIGRKGMFWRHTSNFDLVWQKVKGDEVVCVL